MTRDVAGFGPNPAACALCGGARRPLTKHHLIPRACHGNKWFRKRFTRLDMIHRAAMVCRPCHAAIHAAEPSEKTLGRHWNTIELLLAHPIISRHVQWMRRRTDAA